MPHLVRKINDANPLPITCGIMRKLTDAHDFKDMDFVHITITDSTKRHYHKKLTEVYYVLKGILAVEVDKKIEKLERGQMIMIFPQTNHKAWKIGKTPVEILVACSPPWTEDDEILTE